MFVNIEDLKINKISESKNSGVYSLEPLPRGFGATLGNSLRRVLMTSINGAAVTQIKIEGINHQFTSIKGIKEDVVEITMNLKRIRFKLHTNAPVVATIEKKGNGPVTAGDIDVPSDADVMNPKQHVATISDNKKILKMELIIEPGVGYSPNEERETPKVGVIVLDALFSPIVKASYEVEPTRFGKRTDLDKTIISIETDGSISPINALKNASSILCDYYSTISEGKTSRPKDSDAEALRAPTRVLKPENVMVDELPLQTRTINALRKHGIETLHEVAQKTDEELADIKNLGEKSLSEIRDLLEKEGLRQKDEA